MIRYVVRRLLQAIPLVLGVAAVLFVILSLAPGDPASLYFAPGVSPEAMEQLRRSLGLDEPLPLRFVKWLAALVRGDFGYSVVAGRPVGDLLWSVIPNTLLLTATSLLLIFVVGILIGVVQAVRQGGFTDSVLSFLTLTFYSVPSFWLAIMLILVFSVGARSFWDWPFYFPSSGVVSQGHEFLPLVERLGDHLWHLTLPVLSLTLVVAAGVSRYVRSSMLEVIRQDYVRAARARGLPEHRVIFRHALRNALLPVVTLFGLFFPFLLSGTVFIEAVFAWPGMGKLLVDSIFQRDFPVVMAGTFVFAVMVVVGNLLADLLYAVVDPRIRHGRGEGA